MDLSNWFNCEQQRIKEFHKNNKSPQDRTSIKEPSPGTIDWIVNESIKIEGALIEEKRERALKDLEKAELTPNEFKIKVRLISEHFDKLLKKAGLGKRTIINVKNGKAKTSNRTIKKLQRVFHYPNTLIIDSETIDTALDDIPFQGKGYFCIEHNPIDGEGFEHGYTYCDICKQEIVINVSRYSRVFPNEQGKITVRKLFDIGVSLHSNKQVVLQYNLNYERYLAKNKWNKTNTYKSPPYLKYLICESCLNESKELPRVFGASYKDMLERVINEYPQYNKSKLAGLLGINIVTLERLLKEETNFISHKLAQTLTYILLFEKPENIRKSAGIIQAEVFTDPKNILFNDLFQSLYSLGFNFYYGWKDRNHNKFMLLDGHYLNAKAIEAKLNVNVEDNVATKSLYDVAKLLLDTFSEFISKPIPNKIKCGGVLTNSKFVEDGYTSIKKWLEFWKGQTWPNRWDEHPLFRYTLYLLRFIGESLSLDKSIIDEFFCSQAYFDVRKITIKGFTTGSIVLNYRKQIEYKEGLMSTKLIDYTCPIMVNFSISSSSEYFGKMKISGPQKMAFFPVRKSSYDLSVDYHHLASVFEATMVCFMDIELDDNGIEYIKAYRYFTILRDLNCDISVSIERVDSPFELSNLSW